MPRLRNHKKYGQSINCKNFSPFGKEGPSFTIHLFSMGTDEETQVTMCAFEVWQREPNKGKRFLVCEGEEFETSDCKSDNTMIQLARVISEMSPADNEESRNFHENYTSTLITETKERTHRVNKKRTPKVVDSVEETVTVVEAGSEDPAIEMVD